MINFDKLKYKLSDISIVVGALGVLGILSYLTASTISTLNKISIKELDDEEESWWG